MTSFSEKKNALNYEFKEFVIVDTRIGASDTQERPSARLFCWMLTHHIRCKWIAVILFFEQSHVCHYQHTFNIVQAIEDSKTISSIWNTFQFTHQQYGYNNQTVFNKSTATSIVNIINMLRLPEIHFETFHDIFTTDIHLDNNKIS